MCNIVVLWLLLIPSVVNGASNGKHLPYRAEILPGYEEDRIKSRCDDLDLQPIEGIWYYPEEKMTVVVERYSNTFGEESEDYRVILISASDMSLLPGTVIGYCSRTADGNKYKMWIYSEQRGSVIENPQMCIAELNNGSDELLIERSEINMRVRINFSRFLPKLLKGISAVPSKKDVKVPEGFRKIYPESERRKNVVRYL